jgi:hypothetical protein
MSRIAIGPACVLLCFGMARLNSTGPRDCAITVGMRFLLCVFGLFVWSGAVLAAQEPPTPQSESIHTLHVYTNLIQIPTVVLGPDRERIVKPIRENRFSISLDDGPLFRATHARQEGDDAISLSILLDASGDAAALMPKMGDAIADLAPLSLHPKDHVSIYVVDCSLIRAGNDMPAEKGELKLAVDNALQSWTVRKQNKRQPGCQQSMHLWDAVADVANDLHKVPGRRVILVVSDGVDRGSKSAWKDVMIYAQATGIAIFGMTNIPQPFIGRSRVSPWLSNENPFQSLCELSGGIVLSTATRSPAETLKRFTMMLRERYIVEFPRPANTTPGGHGMVVKVAKGDMDFIRSAGISVPMPDAAVLADPTTVQSDPSLTPEMGTRKAMTKPQ